MCFKKEFLSKLFIFLIVLLFEKLLTYRDFMKKKLHQWLCDHYISRVSVFILDLSLVVIAFAFVQLLLVLHSHVYMPLSYVGIVLSAIVATYGLSFVVLKSYSGILRHSTFRDISLVFVATAISVVVLSIVNTICGPLFHFFMWTNTHLFVHGAVSFGALFVWRLSIKAFFRFTTTSRQIKEVRVAIYGAGVFGTTTYNVLKNSASPRYRVVAFIDDNPFLKNKSVQNIPVVGGVNDLSSLTSLNVEEVVLAISPKLISRKKKDEIATLLMKQKIVFKVAPETEKWIDGSFDVTQIKKIQIRDLLTRLPIEMNTERIGDGLKDRVVMVTGAAGSIGSEIVRQICHFPVARLILIDQAESALYDLQQELKQDKVGVDVMCVVADVSNASRMKTLFSTLSPEVIFHAAAYKHVPLMEENPYEAIRVNVGGCRVLSELAVEFNVRKFVMVSTDKAVNPTNVMGASKRICEMYVQALALKGDHQTSFVTTRFGNVLGSNGSVVPLFEKQIAAGGPITVTDKKITRYFMTIPEACQLVLEAGFMGKGGEIFLFDMGEPVRIYNMAKKMIRLSGLEPYKDIDIQVTGLRDGEKLYEELLANAENTVPTYHEKIMIAKVRTVEYERVASSVVQMLRDLNVVSDLTLVQQMKSLVPEFVSNHSKFCSLDKAMMTNNM